jgi:hypothetical protein
MKSNKDYKIANNSFRNYVYVNQGKMILVGKTKGRKTVGRSKRSWENNIKTNFREVGWGMDWIDLAQERDTWRAVVSGVMNIQVA